LPAWSIAASVSLCRRIAPRIAADSRVPARTASEARSTSRIMAARSTSIRSIVSRIATILVCAVSLPVSGAVGGVSISGREVVSRLRRRLMRLGSM
jgi:hypothetical protein